MSRVSFDVNPKLFTSPEDGSEMVAAQPHSSVTGDNNSPPTYDNLPNDGDEHNNEKQGICSRIVGCIWSTQHTRKFAKDEDRARTALRELLIYLAFLVVCCLIAFGMYSPTQYYYTRAMRSLFLEQEFNEMKFEDLSNFDEFYQWAEGPMLNGLFPERWYNNQPFVEDELHYLLHENRLIGLPRLRQLVVTNNSCPIDSAFSEQIDKCYAPYSVGDAETGGLTPSKTPSAETEGAYVYRTASDLNEGSHWGLVATYDGSGYVQNLDHSFAVSSSIVASLKDNLWLRRGTRALFLDFTVYNANINLFCIVRITAEFPPTGGILSSSQFLSLKLLRYVSTFDYFILACEILFLLFIIYYTVEEIFEFRYLGWRTYLKSVWSWVDITILVFSMVAISYNIYRTLEVRRKLTDLVDEQNQYANFDSLGFWSLAFGILIGVTLFLIWIKLFKYISFNKTMAQLSQTLAKSSTDLLAFTIMFFIIFFSYAQLAYLSFGSFNPDFKTFGESCFTQFRIMLGDFDWDSLQESNRILAPIYFLTFVFFVYFVILNMFIAIINDTYQLVREQQESADAKKNHFQTAWDTMMKALKLRSNKVSIAQDVIAKTKEDGVTEEELTSGMEAQGVERESAMKLFKKYDTDGDHIIDDDERLLMENDLQDEEEEINKEEQRLNAVITRSKSAKSLRRALTMKKSFVSGGTSKEDVEALNRRVTRLENAVGSVVSKMDALLQKLSDMEGMVLSRQGNQDDGALDKLLEDVMNNPRRPSTIDENSV